jgi:hypothetical protein
MILTMLIRLYPRRWRKRYEDEFAALLEEIPLTPLTVLDLLLSALDAHLNFGLEEEGIYAMSAQLRRFTLSSFWSWVVYIIAGLGFYGMLDDNPLTKLAHTGSMALHIAVLVVQAGAILALAAMGFGGLLIALAVIRQALGGRRDVLALLAVTPFSPIVVVAYAVIVIPYFTPIFVGNPATDYSSQPGTMAAYLGLIGLFHAAILGSAWAVASAITRCDLGETAFRFTRPAFRLAAPAMLLTLAGVLAWGIIAFLSFPSLFSEALGLYGMNTELSWVLVVIVMGAATAFSGITALCGSPDGAVPQVA